MPTPKTLFICQKCGASSPKWMGQCAQCHDWNCLMEESVAEESSSRSWTLSSQKNNSPQPLIKSSKKTCSDTSRQSSGFEELDRVLGSGLVEGSYTLLGGDPGIGKSTLLLQVAGKMAQKNNEVLYISGEESFDQLALRAKRLDISTTHLQALTESRLETILKIAKKVKPQLLIIDSIQTIYLESLNSAPGSLTQVRECASRLMALAKSHSISTFIIGHITKDGHIAGPKVLEHMVDTVLSFEGSPNHSYRMVRTLKNRFGPTNELGVFQMNMEGLEEVKNPSELFLSEKKALDHGSCIFPAMEGSRPLLCEIQALSSSSPTALPRRTCIGFDTHRTHLLIAVLDKKLRLGLGKKDIFVNVVGGLKIQEPSADLAVATALISSEASWLAPHQTGFFGEIGLTGEVRACSFPNQRIQEACKLGFNQFVLPAANKKHLKSQKFPNIKNFIFIESIQDLKSVLSNLNAQILSSFKDPSKEASPHRV